MPYKTEKLALASQFLDRRVKLLDCQKERMKVMFGEGVSIRSLAKIFHVNKRLIQFTLFPERKEANLLARKARGGSLQYYDKTTWKDTMKEHRQYKHEILKSIA